jgi:hypothetical protein
MTPSFHSSFFSIEHNAITRAADFFKQETSFAGQKIHNRHLDRMNATLKDYLWNSVTHLQDDLVNSPHPP